MLFKLNNYDILKNGLYKLFIESVCNGNNIILDYIEPELKKIDFMNINETETEIIETSKLLKLICKHLNNYNIPYYYNVNELDNIKLSYYDFETEFYKLYGFEPL